MRCDRCLQPLEGEHGVGLCPFVARRVATAIRADDVPGGFTIENAWREPRTFYSQSEYERALKADGLTLNPHYVPGSKHLSNWAAMTDPQTLANALELVSRPATATREPAVTLDTFQVTSRTAGTITVRAEA